MPSEFLYNLTKNLTAHLRHYLCAVLPLVSEDSVLRTSCKGLCPLTLQTFDFFEKMATRSKNLIFGNK